MTQIDPTATQVAVWLKSLSREQLHEQGWIAINRRFNGITRAARPFLREQFPDAKDQAAAYDGFTLALMSILRFEDIHRLADLLAQDSGQVETIEPTTQVPLPKVNLELPAPQSKPERDADTSS